MTRGQDSKLNANENKERESGVDLQCVPRHVAVIMDGNRRYGKEKYGNSTRGHIEGSKKLIKFTQWCLDEGIEILTVYAFSTENWNRPAVEVSALMSIFCKYCNELRPWAIEKGIRIHVLATESERIPEDLRLAIEQMEAETRHCTKFTMNICLSYGGRNEIVNACKSVAIDLQAGKLNVNQISDTVLQGKMLTSHCCDPEVIIRTSGEERISNFLLWQAAYSEFFFLKKPWPALEKDDLLDVIRDFAHGRTRRFGK
jgi:undecaprenyl diphosphate synthase